MHIMADTQVWAHRGASGWDKQYAPENTLPAFEKAVAMGADGIEIDVQLTRDGEIVIAHDERLERVSNGTGWIKDHTLQELKQLSFSKTHPEYGCTVLPTLAEFLGFMKGNALAINIELKTGMIYYEGLEARTWQLVERMGMGDRVIYSSFNHYSLQKLRQAAPAARIGLLCGASFIDIPDYPQRLGAEAIHPPLGIVDADYIVRCHQAGLAVHVWTVDVKLDMQHLAEWGVDALITDCPDSGRRVVDGDRSWLR